jgi:NAD(P)H-flavin reductase
VLFSIGRALRANGCKVLYFAGYRNPEDVFRMEDIEASADQVIWATDREPRVTPRRPQDSSFVGNIVQAMIAYSQGELGEPLIQLSEVERIIAIGSDRMMNGVRQARHGLLKPYLKPEHVAIGSINSPMQCMMKEICAQCLQRHVDPVTGKQIGYVFSCFNQDQTLDTVDFQNLAGRLKQASMQEKLASMYLEQIWKKRPPAQRV